jgi:aminopeptidase N
MFRRFQFVLLAALAAVPLHADQVDVYSRPVHAERSREYDVLHYRIKLNFDEARRAFTGQTQITLKPLIDGFDTCVLDAETFTVSAVSGEGNVPLRFEQAPGKLTVRLARRYRYHEKLAFTVSYHAANVAVDPERFGMAKGYGLGLDFKPESSDHPRLIGTLSFPTGARHWFPCYDHPNDKATSEVIATVRAEYQVISNGKLVSVSEDRVRHEKTYHWSEELPHATYLFVLAAGPYVMVSDKLGSLPIHYWVYPKDVKDTRRSFGKTPEIIEFFNSEFGYPYPWAKYDQITIPEFRGGAESTNATVIGDHVIHDEKAEKDFPTHWLVAHEAAHQWWGNLLTMRDWSQTWLNEGFATYSEYLYAKHSLGDDEGALNLLTKKNQYLAEARTRYQRPIVFDRWQVPNDNFDRHTYQKGAVVLAMLRSVMGDAAFRRAIAYYLRKHAFQSVDTHDFVVAIRESTGQVLDWFFEQWVYQAGHPILEVGYTWREADKKLALKISQTQQSVPHVPVFRMPVSIGITTASGKQSHRIWIQNREETVELACPEKPLLVRFDEENVLLKEVKFSKPVEELLFQLTAGDALARMEAADELGRLAGGPAVATALRQSAREDRFWAVRREALRALARARLPEDLEFLKQASTDRTPAVRVAALHALGERGDRTLAGYLEDRFRADDSYLVQAEALRALGKCGSTASIPFLRRAGLTKSPDDVIRNAATSALKDVQQ